MADWQQWSDAEDWAEESFQLAKRVTYALPENTVPSASYMATAREVSGKRIVLAGYRLAHLLNELLK